MDPTSTAEGAGPLYETTSFEARLALTPAEWGAAPASSLHGILQGKLQREHEGRCNATGYVRPGSVSLMERSVGAAEQGRFTGNFVFVVRACADVLRPHPGKRLPVRIVRVNRMGAYGVFEEAVRVLLPRDMHEMQGLGLDGLREGDVVSVRLLRSRFQTHDTFILAVGLLEAEAVQVDDQVDQPQFAPNTSPCTAYMATVAPSRPSFTVGVV